MNKHINFCFLLSFLTLTPLILNHYSPLTPITSPIICSDEDNLKKSLSEEVKPKPAEESRKRVSLIDAKRAQNAGIALARIKVPFSEVKERYVRIYIFLY